MLNQALGGLYYRSLCRSSKGTPTDHPVTDPYIGTSGGGWLVGRGLWGQGAGGQGNGSHTSHKLQTLPGNFGFTLWRMKCYFPLVGYED